MTGKRFILKENDLIDDTQLNILLDGGEDKEDMVDLLNELHEENEQLRHDATILIQSNQDYRKENEQLKQFKEDVFNKIDMHLRMLPTARDNEFDEDDGDPSLYVGAIYMLETLKKELEE